MYLKVKLLKILFQSLQLLHSIYIDQFMCYNVILLDSLFPFNYLIIHLAKTHYKIFFLIFNYAETGFVKDRKILIKMMKLQKL
jgi:hypothetical protein